MKPLAILLRAAITFYQYVISPVTGPHCRYQPTCSTYAKEALAVHGAVKGSWLATKRIGRCHPWGGSGYDPVPDGPTAIDGQTAKGAGPAKEQV